jgi:7-cyano-7-deazaguanine reductase
MIEFNLKDSMLGKEASSPEKYDASLLFRIPRSENREQYGIDEEHLPFLGFDVWNCYELSFLTVNGFPVSRVMKMIYSSGSRFLVESKSLKLYLNAFNMDCFGKTVLDAVKKVIEIISQDLSSLLETEVRVILFDVDSEELEAFPTFKHADLARMVPVEKQESMAFTRYKESPELLQGRVTDGLHDYAFRTDLLRSNCRVTNQPDWGDLFVQISTRHEIDLSSVMAYLVSFRKENHFHEEVVEMIYKRFSDCFQPEQLMVAAMYTRRGGIDINPVRVSHPGLLDQALLSINHRVAKTWRQ